MDFSVFILLSLELSLCVLLERINLPSALKNQ